MNEIMTISGIECYEQNGTAYLKLETVARGLGFTRTADSGNVVVRWERVDGYLKDLGVPTCGHDGFIPENIFYRLAMKAKNEAAEHFQAKVADEIIPSIRKHGMYATAETVEKMLSDPDAMIQVFTALKEERAARQALAEKVEQDKPKVLFADAVATAHTSILVGELAKLLKQNGVDIGQNRLFRWMREQGYLIRRKGADFNMPTQKAMEMGLFEIKETVISHADGHTSVTKTPKISGKGQLYFVKRFLG